MVLGKVSGEAGKKVLKGSSVIEVADLLDLKQRRTLANGEDKCLVRRGIDRPEGLVEAVRRNLVVSLMSRKISTG